jgi:hypothetical protein
MRMNNAPDNLDIATRDRVDMLVSRIADAEARTEDWAAFNELAERHPWAWRELAQTQRDHAAMCVAVGVALQSADGVFLPVRAGGTAAMNARPRFAMWAGWAVAACMGFAFFGGLRPPAPSNVPTNAAGVNLTNWTPDDYVEGYVKSGEKTGLVLGEVPRRVLIESRPLERGEGFEVVYVRQFVERAQVSDLLKFATDETGRAVPVRQIAPSRPGSPE